MQPLLLEDVFKTNGVPTYTFVEPSEWAKLLVAIRTPGRGVVVEGPSGIGKTTAVETALHALRISGATKLSARRRPDVEYIEALPDMNGLGVVIVDDFHKLSEDVKESLADYMKSLADSEDRTTKLIVVGINNAGEKLISFASDLVNRLEVIPFESNPVEKVQLLINKGEAAFNVDINVKDDIAYAAQGSFYIAQMLCHEVCLRAKIIEKPSEIRKIEESFEALRAEVWERLAVSFGARCERFCRGTKMRPEGRAPYLHILHWLAEGVEWTLSVREALYSHPELKGSVGQVIEKDYLKNLIENDRELAAVLHFDPFSRQLTVEDPQFVFFIRNMPWLHMARKLGFHAVEFTNRYDFALSFAGTDRDIAKRLFEALAEEQVEVFYDKNEQHRILAVDVEDYLRPIYQTEARFVICLLGAEYPQRIWTNIESDAFRHRFKDGDVIPIWFKNVPQGIFDDSRRIGGYMFDPDGDVDGQVQEIKALLLRKLQDARIADATE